MRGRPPKVLAVDDRAAAVKLLRDTSGGLSRDGLCAQLPAAPMRALRDLHRCWNRATAGRGSLLRGTLRWPVPGRVLAIDLTDVPREALGPCVPKLLYARDPASRKRAWQPAGA